MSHTLKLNRDFGVVVLRAKDTMSRDEIRRVFEEMVSLPGFREGLSLVADFRGSGTALTGDDIRELAHEARETDAAWGDAKWAIIASDALLFGLSRMFGTLTDDHQVTTHVFHDAKAADDWLGVGVDVKDILALTPDD